MLFRVLPVSAPTSALLTVTPDACAVARWIESQRISSQALRSEAGLK